MHVKVFAWAWMHHRTRNVQEVGYKLQPNFSAFSERSVDAPGERKTGKEEEGEAKHESKNSRDGGAARELQSEREAEALFVEN